MGMNIGTIKKITGEIGSLSDEIKSFKKSIEENSGELSKITKQIDKKEQMRLKEIKEEELRVRTESERFPLAKNSEPAIKQAEVKVNMDVMKIMRKLDIL